MFFYLLKVIVKEIKLLLILLFLSSSSSVRAWDGYDYEEGEYIEIEKGNLVREGEEIEVYHYDTGEYKDEEVQSVDSDEVETYDYGTGEYHTYDMD